MDLEIGKTSYDFKTGSYFGIAKSKTSIDTRFEVFYKNGKVNMDNYESRVLSLWNTRQRLEDEYSAIAKNLVSKELGYDNNTTMVDEESMLPLTLDMKFDKELFISPKVVIRLDLEDNSLDVIAKIITNAHRSFVKNNCNFDEYGLYAQNSDRYYVDVTRVTPADIESGNLRSLLEKAKTNRSGNGMSVLIKEKNKD
ncbi:MAG: hypothetical protein ACI8WT_001532 [Clostridium sp.]|jgi:hypothetical protein